MKRPFCYIGDKKYQLECVSGVIRFPNNGSSAIKDTDFNSAYVEYAEGKRPLSVIEQYLTSTGCSYELVYGNLSKGGINNGIVKQRGETQKFKLYR